MTNGLRRFARPPDPVVADLPRIGKRTQDDGAEHCEMCGEVVDPRHGHVVNLERRTLVCACRGCYLLFTRDGAAGGKYRAIPDRYRHDPAHPVTDTDWDELQVPVATAFFFHNSALDRIVGSYPSPGGATECELDLAGWERLAATHPLLRLLEPDVEALMFTRVDGAMEAYLIPTDACYELVGRIRLLWSGLDGGVEVREALADFVSNLRARSRPLRV